MAIGDDFSVTVGGDIRHDSGSTNYTVLELHRWLQDLADQASSSGNDLVDITSSNPSDRSTDNIITLNSPYNIDDTAAEYLYDGSITQAGGDVVYSGLIVVGSLASSTTLQVVQNNVLYDGDSPFWGTGINIDAANNILTRMLIKTRTGGADVDGKRIRVTAREFGDTYAEFEVTMGLGNSTAAIFTNTDLNNTTDAGTVSGWTEITNVEGYQQINLNNGSGARDYYSQWNRDTYTINQLYERTKWLTRRGTSSTIHGMDGELFRGITHQWNYDNEANGPFVEEEILSWGTGATAGTGILLALDDNGTTGVMWIQKLTGVAPTNNLQITGVSSSATCDVDGTVTARTVSPAFLGASTGSSIIGAFGIGIEAADLTTNDKLFDLTNTQQQPPNVVVFTVSGLDYSGGEEDRVLVAPKDTGLAIKFDQLALNTTLNGAGVTSVVCTTTIPTDTPTTGTIRIELDSGLYRRIAYTSYSSATFTIGSTDFTDPNDATSGNNIFISYIDDIASAATATFQGVYASDRDLFIRVRNGGTSPIKTFESSGTLTSSGGSATAIRTSDS